MGVVYACVWFFIQAAQKYVTGTATGARGYQILAHVRERVVDCAVL